MHESAPTRRRLLLGVGLVALVVRLLHNQALLADPLYFNPLGGNLPYLLLGDRIAGGEWFPMDGAFTVNSPLYPYIVAFVFKLFGSGALFALRVAGAVADSATCALVALLALRHFGVVSGWAAGLVLAVYGPAIFFATELTPVPFTLLLLTGAVALLDGTPSTRRFATAGLLFGLAAATRPNALVAGALALWVPFARREPGRGRLTAAVGLGLVLGVAPVTVANAVTSGRFVPLTLSAGHNFYIGHNPAAQAQYHLPAALDGDVFQSMKSLAEAAEGRAFGEEEVSGYYFGRALTHMIEDPGREVGLVLRRAALLFNDFEATTYASFDYQRAFSPWLRWGPSFMWLLLLAAPGMLLAFDRRRLHLWLPLAAAAVTVLLFFYIARLRVLMLPSLAIFAGAAVGRGVDVYRARDRGALLVALAVGASAAAFSSLPLLRSDTSNEWNKAGGVLRVQGRFAEAELALGRAERENPLNANTYRNLAVLFRETGRLEEAATAEARAGELLAGQEAEGAAFRRALEGG